ncbi:hypothetical protein SAMN05216586_1161, partial [Halopseudomonas aestusnigri]
HVLHPTRRSSTFNRTVRPRMGKSRIERWQYSWMVVLG